MLDRRRQTQDENMGRLPAVAHLANPYVPFQMEDPPKYEPRKALVRGTLFPGLDLPFMGMVNKEEKPLTPRTEMQVLAFALQELALYLDTHREDRQALQMYRQYQQVYHDAMAAYSQKCGPISHSVPDEMENYAWLDDPWPWEYSKN